MKRRAMKKWIPKDTCYCYDITTGKVCKWWNKLRTITLDQTNCEYYQDCKSKGHICTSCSHDIIECKYLRYIDTDEDSLLFDMCKECGVKDDIKLFKKRRNVYV